jgi:hypothetical protein
MPDMDHLPGVPAHCGLFQEDFEEEEHKDGELKLDGRILSALPLTAEYQASIFNRLPLNSAGKDAVAQQLFGKAVSEGRVPGFVQQEHVDYRLWRVQEPDPADKSVRQEDDGGPDAGRP